MNAIHWLFSYGTLRDPAAQRALFGREPAGVDDTLIGFTLDSIVITDPDVIRTSGSDRHPIVRRGSSTQRVSGSAFLLTDAELAAVDRYEVADYARVSIVLASGREAVVYVPREEVFRARDDAEVAIVEPDAALLARLLPVARRIFADTFATNYDKAAFDAFCDAVYQPGGSMSADFSRPEVLWRVATVADEPIGYVKLTPLRAPAANPQPRAMEMQQLYVLREWHGAGVADRLAVWAVDTAQAAGVPEIYLTVFDHNERAKRFYGRHGFGEVGRCTFQIGDQIDDDRIWRRSLKPSGKVDQSEAEVGADLHTGAASAPAP